MYTNDALSTTTPAGSRSSTSKYFDISPSCAKYSTNAEWSCNTLSTMCIIEDYWSNSGPLLFQIQAS